MAYLALLLFLISSIGALMTFKASTSLPGETLYSYKIGVDERIEEFLAHTPESQTRLDLLLLTRRLSEARQLALHGKLDARAQNEVTNNIEFHVNNLTYAIDQLTTSGSYTDATQLADSLYQTLSFETDQVAELSSLGSTNLQVSLASVVTKLRTTTSTVALKANKLQTLALNNSEKKQNQMTITAAPTSAQAKIGK